MQAVLHDGRVLEFPDGTDPTTIQAAVKRVLANPTGFGGAPHGSALGDIAREARAGVMNLVGGAAAPIARVGAEAVNDITTPPGSPVKPPLDPNAIAGRVSQFFTPPAPQTVEEAGVRNAAGAPFEAAGRAGAAVESQLPPDVNRVLGEAVSNTLGTVPLAEGARALRGAAPAAAVARSPAEVAAAAGYKGLASKADLKAPGAQAVTDALLSSELKLPTGAKPNVAAVQDARTAGPGKVYNAAESSMPATMSTAQLAPYIRGISGPVSLLGNPESVAALTQTILGKPDFTPDVLFNTIRQARERGAAGLDSDLPDAQALGEAHLKLANGLENFVGDQLSANPNALVSLDQYKGARVDMAKSYLAEKALKGGEHFDPTIYAKAAQRDPNLLTGNGAIVGTVANTLPAAASQGAVRGIGGAVGAALGTGAGLALEHALPAAGLGGPVGGAVLGSIVAPAAQAAARSLRTGGDVEAAAAAHQNPALSYFHQPDYAFPSQPAPAPPAQGPLPLNPQLDLQPPAGAVGPAPPRGLPTDLGNQFPMFGDNLTLSTPGEVGRPPAPSVQPPLPLNPALRLKQPPGRVGKSKPNIADLADEFYRGEG